MPSSNAKAVALAALLLLLGHCANSLIIPEELPTILSLIYSNIPPIKKGTDSRLGLGFRLGEHADFQVLLELGPQKETDPIGNDVDSKRKRAATMIAAMRGDLGPWAQAVAKYQMEQKIKKVLEKYKLSPEKASKSKDYADKNTEDKSEGNEWLSKWSQGLEVNPDSPAPVPEYTSTRKNLSHVNRMRVVNVPSTSDSQKDSAKSDLDILRQLFGNNTNEAKSA
ncbi:uncharacterized protein LOC100115352 [Nasonia vitripennis]|uniref:Uncharacterized protein n=1 Tax=Nasonia vitripennis TaxID=7425 RepID=A0A7M7QA40_NASVI|nr:uncharacterized protein LOC100115352 [Nasonia vitripennis]